jgi:excisionase family DNA binding protein
MVYYSASQVAERWNVHPKLIYNLAASGELPSLKIGKKIIRIPHESLIEYESKIQKNREVAK